MCYMTVLRTDSAEDLERIGTPLVRFSREMPGLPEESHLAYAHRWFVASRHGCSCGFRHLYVASVTLGFGEPEDWFPEEAADVEATREVVAQIRRLVAEGARVDCVDAWAHGKPTAELAATVHVDLGTMGDRTFRFFENHRFVFERVANDGTSVEPAVSRRGPRDGAGRVP